MVLQSFRQYKAFEDSSHVKAYAINHPSLSRLNDKVKGPIAPPARPDQQPSTAPSEQNVRKTATSPVTSLPNPTNEESVDAESPTSNSSSTRSECVDEPNEMPGNVAGERVEEGEREKARAVPEVEHDDPFLVSWDEDEAANPMNWSWARKWALIGMVTSIALLVGAAASIDSAAADQAAEFFGVTVEVMGLETAVFLIGFGLAAPFLGSLSEIGGRNPIYAVTLLFFVIFEIGCALAPNIQTRVILRFFAGVFGSTPLSNAGGSIADVVDSRQRTFVFPIFANAGFLGPVLGPVIGGYLGQKVGQEWCDWLTAIWGGATLIVVVCFMPETYGPVLLKMKAKHVRDATGDQRYKSALEKERERVPFKKHFRHVLALPFLYLIYEPIVLLVSLYMTVVYIILFGDFTAYPLIFEPFNFNTGEQGLAFIPIAIGLFCTTAFVPLVYKRYVRIMNEVQEKERNDGDKNWEKALPPPEERLVFAMIGTFLVPVGLFYQAWTSFPFLSPWPCLSAGIIFGAGILTCFISSYQYIIDVYQAGSATALGSLTFVRYIVSGGAIMFTPPMYERLGNQWALSLLAFLSLACSAIPWIFYIYGHRIRQWSRYAPADD